MRDLYRDVTNKVIAELQAGVRPWVKPWSLTRGRNIACNAVSNRAYSGINMLLLWTAVRHNWPQPRFLTFKQAQATGGHVRKGEHGSTVIFVKDFQIKEESDSDAEKTRSVHFLRAYTVFNITQCDELPDRITTPPPGPNPDQRDALVDEFVAATGAIIHHRDHVDCAYYAPGLDEIVLPQFGMFRDRAHYCAVLFHELVHWTKHPSRLDRQLGARFGLQAKAAEELVAELGAAFLCAEFAIDGFIPHAAYLESYITLLKDDPKAIFTAAARAQAAVDYLREKILKEIEATREAAYA